MQKVLDIDTLCSTVFDGLESNYSDVSWLASRAISVHEKLEAHRNKRLEPKLGSRFSGSYKTFLSADAVETRTRTGFDTPQSFLKP